MCICIAGGQKRKEKRREERALVPPHAEAIKVGRACSVIYRQAGELTACGRIGQVASSSTGLAHLPLRVLASFGCRAACAAVYHTCVAFNLAVTF